MASATALPMVLPVVTASHKQSQTNPSFKPLPSKTLQPALPKLSSSSSSPGRISGLESHHKEQLVSGLTALALTAAMVVPEIAEAAQPGFSPSLKNFLLSIVAGGVVLGAITGAVIGVSNFDPVKRS